MSFPVTTLSLLRTAVGLSSLILPAQTSRLFYIPPSDSSILARLFGSRDLVLGLYLYLSRTDDSKTRRTALLLGMTVDAIDVLSTVACVLQGELGWEAATAAGGGAIAAIGLGWWGLSK
ncbi:hypothetical protein EPUS_02767 [Endocarpon pusillum Z07020]|uniref:Uncharacterized protein n=1 Tax=Endocarpon pusillum (strain Z07020 / HMAS-L-300199) TaxID=1263415 RepID=U1G9E2_ENDPU|nr:uncharacterized protein EPUS_02767 [Endocarpon pusillum Z07020]ERF68311.1 hypothetical protein EPUS_02767 [Endocarpon pusillum Z07020]